MKWSELSDKEKVRLILQYIIPHDMGDIVYERGDMHTPRGKDASTIVWNYPIAAWDDLVGCWRTVASVGSLSIEIFDPLHDMNDAWRIFQAMEEKHENAHISNDQMLEFMDRTVERWKAYRSTRDLDYLPAAADICLDALLALGVEIEP